MNKSYSPDDAITKSRRPVTAVPGRSRGILQPSITKEGAGSFYSLCDLNSKTPVSLVTHPLSAFKSGNDYTTIMTCTQNTHRRRVHPTPFPSACYIHVREEW
ncbi:Xylosidase/arabinosidase [Fusarium oxysporum f. sp. albedinis]|nr:Xylosidase/arabinosidase [Fusarium oxysporum f. sp. albedinis]